MQTMSSSLPTYGEAAAIVAEYARKLVDSSHEVERVELAAARGRVLARAITADLDQPPFARSTRDGFACRAEEISSHAWVPVAGATHAGEIPSGPLPQHAAWEIMTGAPVPAGADAVVMIEHTERAADRIRLLDGRSVSPSDNIVAQGAQSRRGDELLPTGTVLGAGQIALAASCGYPSVEVYARPRVAILTTGDELVPVDETPGPGQIRNSNGSMLEALVVGAGGDLWMTLRAADNAESLDAALSVSAEADLLLISGGVSAGKYDLVEPALQRLGATFHFTGVQMQPGKPLVFGEAPRAGLGKTLPFFGLPGNPISSAVTFLLFAAQVVRALGGARETAPGFGMARLSRTTDRKGKPGLTRFLPGRYSWNEKSGSMDVATVSWHGSGDLPAFARSNCCVVIPEDVGVIDEGAMVRILFL